MQTMQIMNEVLIHWPIGLMSSVHQWSGKPEFNPRSSHTKDLEEKKKWYLMPPCFTLSIIRQGLRVKWSNPGKGVAPSPTLRCSSYWKGSLRVTLNYSHQLYFYLLILLHIESHKSHSSYKVKASMTWVSTYQKQLYIDQQELGFQF